MQNGLVVAEAVSKSYGSGDASVVALSDVSMSVHAGEFLLIRGPSGSGKTTLLHCLSTVATPDSGVIRFEGEDVAAMPDDARSDLRARAMGFVFQRSNLLPALTIAENVNLPLVLLGWERAQIESRTGEVLEIVGLGDRGGFRPDQLSGGQYQLASLARAIAAEPKIIWADEPTGALDSDNGERLLTTLKAIVEGGSTLVMVSHDPSAEPFADRVIGLRDGRLRPV
jgi:putative ABC transport system ATP-binding protein